MVAPRAPRLDLGDEGLMCLGCAEPRCRSEGCDVLLVDGSRPCVLCFVDDQQPSRGGTVVAHVAMLSHPRDERLLREGDTTGSMSPVRDGIKHGLLPPWRTGTRQGVSLVPAPVKGEERREVAVSRGNADA